MFRERSSAPDTSVPFRPLFELPARTVTKQQISSAWYDPRGISMYYRFEVRRGSTVIVAFAAANAATKGLFTGNGTVAGSAVVAETVTVNLVLAGRVLPYVHRYTIRKVSSGGVVTEEPGTLVVTGPGSYSISWTAAIGGSARMDLSGNKFQFNLPNDETFP